MTLKYPEFFRERFIKPRREAAGVIFGRGVERGEIDQNLNRELVLDLVYGPPIYRLIVGYAPLEDKLADERGRSCLEVWIKDARKGLELQVRVPENTASLVGKQSGTLRAHIFPVSRLAQALPGPNRLNERSGVIAAAGDVRVDLIVAWKKEMSSVVLRSFLDLVSAKASRIRSQGELRSRAKPAKIDKF
jgi:hypothetical protein